MGVFFAEGSVTQYLKIEYCTQDGCDAATVGSDYGSEYVPPETSASVTLGTRLFDESLVIGLRTTINSGRALEKQTLGGVTSPFLWPNSMIYDLFASYEVTENVQLTFSAENLTDEYYFDPLSVTGVPSPGLTVRAGLTLKF